MLKWWKLFFGITVLIGCDGPNDKKSFSIGDSFTETNLSSSNNFVNYQDSMVANWQPATSIKWINYDSQRVNSGKPYSFNLNGFSQKEITRNSFHSISPEYALQSKGATDSVVFNLNQIPSRPLRLKTYLLGQPTINKTYYPQMQVEASEPILIFNKEHGVINGANVNCLLQDKLGRIWIGTEEGLSIYDGEYSYNYKKAQGLSDKRVWSLTEDNWGRVWVGTWAGFDVIDLSKNTVSRVNSSGWLRKNYGFALQTDAKGRIWLGTMRGAYIIDLEQNKIYQITKEYGLSNNVVKNFMEDHQKRIWVATNGGINVIDLKNESIQSLGAKQGLADTLVKCFSEDKNHHILIGSDVGLYQWDEMTQTSKKFGLSSGLPDSSIRSLAIDKNGLIHAGTRSKGIIVINPEFNLAKTIGKKDGLSSEYIPVQMFDSEDQHWMGGYNGINIINNQIGKLDFLGPKNGIMERNFYNLMEDNSNRIWISGLKGINIYDQETQLTTPLHSSDLRSNSGVMATLQSSSGLFYIGTWGGGLKIIDPKANTLREINQKNGLAHNHINFLKEDANGNIWIGTLGGLSRYNPNTGRIKTTVRPDNSGGLNYLDLHFGSNHKIWLATAVGVLELDTKTFQIQSCKLTGHTYGERINCLLIDANNRLWIGTDENGLFIYNPTSKYFTQYTTKDGLTNMSINSMVNYNKQVYLTTDNSLSLMGIDYRDIKSFTKSQGLSSTLFEQKSVLHTSSGQLWFGNKESITILDPINPFSNINQTHITQVLVEGTNPNYQSINRTLNKIKPNDTLWVPNVDSFYIPNVKEGTSYSDFHFDSLLFPFQTPQNLVLNYKQNQISFYFSGIYVNEQNQAKYKYILEGLDEEWGELTSTNYIIYRNLDPGEYVFKVTSCGITEACGRPAEIYFVIHPPLWRTKFFYVLCVLGVAIFIYFYNDYRVSLFKKQTDELELQVANRTVEFRQEKERAEQSEQFKQQFLANMSHEIRTPMNAVLGMTNLALDTPLNKKQKDYLTAVQKSSENLLVIINDILDLSKLEAGKMELEHIPFKVRDVIDQVKNTLRFKAEEKGLVFTTKILNNVPEAVIGDPSRLVQVLINLCGNAIKFTEKGSVHLTASKKHHTSATLIFEIEDTGIGIPPDKLKSLFISFNQVDSSTYRRFGGTGLGLTISKTFVNLQNGEIKVFSKLNEGSKFTVCIPFEEATDTHLEILDNKQIIDTSVLQGIRILLAEDNVYNQIVAIDTLNHLIIDATIDIANDGLEAIEQLKNNDYDVILMDINMPKMDGLQATMEIRSRLSQDKKDIPIIALTASVLNSDIEKCINAGMSGYIPKPFTRNELISELMRFYCNPFRKSEQLSNSISINPIDYPKKTTVTDLSFLRDFCNNDEIKVKKYTSMYINSISPAITNFVILKEEKKWNELKSLLHTIKPQIKFMGMDVAYALLLEMETLLADKMPDISIEEKLDLFVSQCVASIEELS